MSLPSGAGFQPARLSTTPLTQSDARAEPTATRGDLRRLLFSSSLLLFSPRSSLPAQLHQSRRVMSLGQAGNRHRAKHLQNPVVYAAQRLAHRANLGMVADAV